MSESSIPEILEPIGSQVLAKRLPPETLRKETFLILPEISQWDSFQCEIISVGPGEFFLDGSREEMGVKPGDIVIIPQGVEDGHQLEDGSFVVNICAVEARVI